MKPEVQMHQALVDFLAKLATDPKFYAEFQRNPDEVMYQAGLSPPEIAAIKCGKAAELAGLVGQGQSVYLGPGQVQCAPVPACAGFPVALPITWVPVAFGVMYIPVVVSPVLSPVPVPVLAHAVPVLAHAVPTPPPPVLAHAVPTPPPPVLAHAVPCPPKPPSNPGPEQK